QYQRHGGKDTRVVFQNMVQMRRIHWIAAESDAQGIEHGIPLGISVNLFVKGPVHQRFTFDHYGLLPSYWACQGKTSRVRSSGMKEDRQPSPTCSVRLC